MAAKFVRSMFDSYEDDIAIRMGHIGSAPPTVDLQTFTPPNQPEVVWRSDDGKVAVEAVAVHHEPVPDAVAYRVTTPTGIVVISGDTRVCQEVEELSGGCDVLVHEACRATALHDAIKGTVAVTIFSYHADTVRLGALAERAQVPQVILTHLIPARSCTDDEGAFSKDLRDWRLRGQITVGETSQRSRSTTHAAPHRDGRHGHPRIERG